jgi:hypothetical protein
MNIEQVLSEERNIREYSGPQTADRDFMSVNNDESSDNNKL